MNEQLKERIVSVVRTNGQGLITGENLQETLLDVVDNLVATSSAHANSAGKVDFKLKVEGPLGNSEFDGSEEVTLDLNGYATSASVNAATESLKGWVEDKHYLTEHQDISYLATSASVTASINEATQSVKAWVKDQHYLTSASLSGSVTEEVVNMKIEEATASVEQWVEDQHYLTEHQDISYLATTASVTELSASVAEDFANLDIPDVSGFATTSSVTASINEATESVKSWVGDQGYLTEHQDISYLATTASVNSLSSSVAEDFANLDIPDVSGLATTASVNELSSSVAEDIKFIGTEYATTASVEEAINTATQSVETWVKDQHYLTSASLSGSVTEEVVDMKIEEATASVKGWVEDQHYLTEHQDISYLATTQSVTDLSSSVAESIENIDIPDVSVYATTASVTSSINEATESVKSWVGDQGYLTEHQDISYLATTASVLNVSESVSNLSSSVAEDFANLDIPDISGLATTASVNQLSASVAESIENIDIPDVSVYATSASVTASINEATESVKGWVEDKHYLTEHQDISYLATTQSVSQLSASVAESIENIDIPDVGGFATTASVTASINEATASVKGWVTEQGYLTEHQSLAGLFASTSYSSQDKKIYFFDKTSTLVGEINATDFIKDGMVDGVTIDTGSNQLVITFNTDAGKEDITLDLNQIFNPNNYYIKSEVDTIATASVSQSQAWVEEQGYLTEHQDISYLATTASVTGVSESVFNLSSSVASDFENLEIPDISGLATTASVTSSINAATESVKTWVGNQGYLTEHQDISYLATSASVLAVSESVSSLSSSVAEDFANLDIPDISGLATTQSVLNVSSSVNALSESVAETIESIDIPDVSIYATSASVTSSINAATESVKSWVTEQGYLTEHQDISGLATTASVLSVSESVSALSESVAEDFANLDIPDISGLATTASVNELSSSVSNTLSTLATTQSVNSLSASVAQDFDNLVIPDVSIYQTTASFNEYSSSIGTISASFDERIENAGDSLWETGSAALSIVQPGSNNKAYGKGSVVMGSGSQGSGLYSYAEGIGTRADSEGSHAEGQGTQASGAPSHAEGYNTQADGNNGSHAEGWNTTARGRASHAEGYKTTASIDFSHTEGDSTQAKGASSHAEGYHTVASNANEHAEGRWNATAPLQIHSVGIGSEGDRKNAISIIATGSSATPSASVYIYGVGTYDGTNPTPGVNDVATLINAGGGGGDSLWKAGSGELSIVQPGCGNSVIPTASISEATGAIAVGSGSAAMGNWAFAQGYHTWASGNYSHAEGNYTHANGNYSHAEGEFAVADGISSHAEGQNAKAQGHRSHAEGCFTTTLGNYSHVEGAQAVAEGWAAHAEGEWTHASGSFAHAEGSFAHAEGSCSHAEGYGTTASNEYEHAQGRWNAPAPGQIFSVGAGSGEPDQSSVPTVPTLRKNAISIITGSGATPSASIYVYGIGGYDGTNPSPGTNDLATIVNAGGGGGGTDTVLRSFLFDSQSVTITSLDCTKTNLYGSINTDVTLGINTYPAAGRSVAVTIQNTDANNSHSVVIPDVLGTYDVHCNGATSGSLVIPAGEIGDMVITEMGGDLYIRTSLEVSAGGGGGTTNYNDLTNKPSINNVTLSGNKSLGDLGAEASSNKVTTLTAASTDTQYPSAKCVYDLVGNVEAALQALR